MIEIGEFDILSYRGASYSFLNSKILLETGCTNILQDLNKLCKIVLEFQCNIRVMAIMFVIINFNHQSFIK